MEDIIQFFLDLLQVTGGDLAPENIDNLAIHTIILKAFLSLVSRQWPKEILQEPPGSMEGCGRFNDAIF
jgi:hypothetical protein